MDNVQAALNSLKQEEKSLIDQITLLQARLQEIRSAIGPLDGILKGRAVTNQWGSSTSAILNIAATVSGSKRYESMKMPEAIKDILTKEQSLKSAEITRRLLAGGYQSQSDQVTNLVGMTLKRLEEKGVFKRDKENNWSLA